MMIKFKQNVKISATFAGTIIGAGFASGQEVALYFGEQNIIIPLLACFFIGVFCFVFLELGRLYNGNIFSSLNVNINLGFTYLVRLINLIIFSAMIAGSEFIIRQAFNIVGGGLISLIIAVNVVISGLNKVKLLNTFVIPTIILLIIILYFNGNSEFENSYNYNFFSPIIYAGMNLISGGYLISKFAADIDQKQSIAISVMSIVIVGVLLISIYLLIQNNIYSIMPLLAVAYEQDLSFIGAIIIYLAVFTTLVSSLVIVSDMKRKSVYTTSIVGALISIWGFQNIINYAYKPIGIVGLALTLFCIYLLIIQFLRSRSQVNKLFHS